MAVTGVFDNNATKAGSSAMTPILRKNYKETSMTVVSSGAESKATSIKENPNVLQSVAASATTSQKDQITGIGVASPNAKGSKKLTIEPIPEKIEEITKGVKGVEGETTASEAEAQLPRTTNERPLDKLN